MKTYDLVKNACGPNRNMTTFANEISVDYAISPASLYRIASGNIKEPVSEDLLLAIVEHKDKGSSVTLEALNAAFNEILDKSQKPTREVSHNPFEDSRRIIQRARQTILDKAVSSGAKIQSLPTAGDNKLKTYDLALQIEVEGITQRAYFDIRPALGYRNYGLIEQFVGRLALTETSPDEIFYLVFAKDPALKDKGRVPLLNYDVIADKLENSKKQEAAINIVCINYTEAPLPEIRELCLDPDKGLLAFHAN